MAIEFNNGLPTQELCNLYRNDPHFHVEVVKLFLAVKKQRETLKHFRMPKRNSIAESEEEYGYASCASLEEESKEERKCSAPSTQRKACSANPIKQFNSLRPENENDQEEVAQFFLNEVEKNPD